MLDKKLAVIVISLLLTSGICGCLEIKSVKGKFTYSPEISAPDETVYFTDESSSSEGEIDSWYWDFGDGNTSNEKNPTHTYATSGNYTVTLTVTDNIGNTDDDTTWAYILENLTADADGPYNGYVGLTIQFYGSATGGTGIYTWDWNFGDGTPHSNLQNPTHPYTTAGNHTVTLTVTDNEENISVDTTWANIVPTATIIKIVPSAKTVNQGQIFEVEVEIDPAEPIRTVSFDLSFDPSLLQLNSISDGIFDIFVPGSIDNGFINGSAGSMYGSGTINSPSVIATLIFTATNGGTSTLDLFSLTALDATGVPVTVVDHDGSVTVQTSVGPLTAYADGPYHSLIGEPIQVYGSASGGTPLYSYNWSFGDGRYSNKQNPAHTYTYADTFTVILTVTDAESNIAADTTTVTASQNKLPSAYFTYSPAKAETGETVKFKDSSIDEDGTIVNWTWDFGDGNTSNERDPSHKYSKAGTYTVTLTVTDDYGDTDSYTRTITVKKEKKGTPGFEFAFLIVAIASMILLKRRSYKNR